MPFRWPRHAIVALGTLGIVVNRSGTKEVVDRVDHLIRTAIRMGRQSA
jgi:hypothetical protein